MRVDTKLSQWAAAVAVVALASVAPAAAEAQTPGSGTEDKTAVQIETILKEVQLGLSKVQATLVEESLPPLASVQLTLKTVVKHEGGPVFKFLVFSFGKKWEKERAQSLTLTLKPPKPATSEVSSKRTVADMLAGAIVSAARGANSLSPAIHHLI